jgi:multicomponent Na+:H+ antiporter subunit G
MSVIDFLSAGLIVAGAFFFLAGTAGLLRFPDVYTRIHALTKADNVGLGLTIAGLLLRAGAWSVAGKLLLIWLLALLASATSGHLIARAAHRAGIRPWTADVDR